MRYQGYLDLARANSMFSAVSAAGYVRGTLRANERGVLLTGK
jgi:hypothetical protein